ncbi:Fmu (Sun) domain-containing protein [Longitalea arenae]|uniref:Fmu (Sun) domain-containing protein n=1 Tax=Longitalea arenae TaxID=2812558 RepID=UPI001967C59D|nr:Fmu (Sun) domain-containing protein [Longitalea arenae]
MKYFSHLNTAVQLLQQYDGSVPFGSFIKSFFSQYKKFGSRDRKNIAHLCYAFFRLGKALPQLPLEQRILTGLFFCSPEPNELLQHLKPAWNEQAHGSLPQKFQLINDTLAPVTIQEVFPWTNELSAGMDQTAFNASFFTQPDLFLRLRPGKEAAVKSKLHEAAIPFRVLNSSCLALPNASKIDTIIETDREAVIQDYSSQRIGELMELIRSSTGQSAKTLKLWDACAASGGKSILASDIFNRIDLTVSDLRKSILINLEKRFAAAGIRNYHSFTGDLSAAPIDHPSTFDIIITDVPCTGAGTWSRTPEQLYYFDHVQVDRYSALQKKIVQHALAALRPGGFLLYCTCSVFKKENEEVVQFIQDRHSLQLLQTNLFTGYDQKADTLFGALFQKS